MNEYEVTNEGITYTVTELDNGELLIVVKEDI